MTRCLRWRGVAIGPRNKRLEIASFSVVGDMQHNIWLFKAVRHPTLHTHLPLRMAGNTTISSSGITSTEGVRDTRFLLKLFVHA